MRDKKWHILMREDSSVPLCWGTRCLEFDTQASAERFLFHLSPNFARDATLKECIFYYDGGYLNATGLIYDNSIDGLRKVKEI